MCGDRRRRPFNLPTSSDSCADTTVPRERYHFLARPLSGLSVVSKHHSWLLHQMRPADFSNQIAQPQHLFVCMVQRHVFILSRTFPYVLMLLGLPQYSSS